MLPDQNAAHPEDRCGHCRTRADSAEPNGYCGRAVRISRWRSTNLSKSMHSIHHRASVRHYDSSLTLAPKISKLHVVAEGAGS
jgi:hypothetical protein